MYSRYLTSIQPVASVSYFLSSSNVLPFLGPTVKFL